ncbi:MAG: AIPR family protein [Chlorobiales bacterium]|nr:AIPR family protein [Chlorobiales bacterium]
MRNKGLKMSSVDNIQIRQTWIEEQIEKYSKELGETEDNALLFLAASLLLNCAPEDIEAEDIVDGIQDKQIDFIHIEDDQAGKAEISIIQSKNTKGFSSNIVIQIKNGLDWIFERPKSEVNKISNPSFKAKILEIRTLRTEYGASNLSVKVYHASNGDKTMLSAEYIEEAQALNDKYANLGFDTFSFDQLGAHELIELLNEGDKSKKKINLQLPIVYDINRASVMEFSQGDTKSFVCTVLGRDLAKAAMTEPRDSIFDLNVRPYYGSKGKVNKDIWETSTGSEAERFWFLNNGVTMVCDSFDFTRDPDNPILKITNAQIVNGCQTTVTLRQALESGELDPAVKVLLRVYSTDNPSLVDKITLTTNNQNKVTDRDLRANDPVQRDIERVMVEQYNHFYERKNKQHKAIRGPNRKRIVPSPKAAQAYLAIVRAKPANARGYLGAIWSDFYGEIFEKASVADLLVAYKIYQMCHAEARAAKRLKNISERERACRVYGIFHIARTMGNLTLKDKWGHQNMESVEKILEKFEDDKIPLSLYENALSIVMEIREKDEKSHSVPAMYFKNSISQRNLNSKIKG